MSALDTLTSTPFVATAPTAPALDALTATPPAPPVVPATTQSLSALTSTPFVAPKPAVAPALASVTASPYFQGKEPSGSFLGISDQVDPYSGRPYFAYRTPGATATTTDLTRTAPKTNPEVATPQPRNDFTNERMPESASQQVRKAQGATPSEQLDHRMALALGGSNNPSNLKLIPTSENQAAGQGEGTMSSDIATGKMSLFDAQKQEALDKGLSAPWVDEQNKGLLDNLKDIEDKTGITRATDWFESIANPTYESVNGAGNAFYNAISDLKTNPSDISKWSGDALSGIANSLSAIVSAGSAGFSALSSGAERVPVLKQANDAVNWLIGKGGEAGAGTVGLAIDKLPISDEAKTNLKAPLQQIGSLAGQLIAGGIIFHELGSAVKAKGNVATLADLHVQDFKNISNKVNTVATSLASRLPKTAAEAQRGFVKIPGLGNQETTVTPENAKPTTPEETAAQYREQVLEPAAAEGKPMIISADDMKDHFGGDYAPENHPMYSKAAYNLVPEMAGKNDNPRVVYTAGGPGSGKSELVRAEATNGFDGVVVDSNLANPEGAAKQIAQLREMGKSPEIHMILQDPERAYHFTKLREANGEHPVSENTFVQNHSAEGVPASVIKLAEEHNVPVKLIDARKALSREAIRDLSPEVNPIATLKKIGYTKEQLQGIVDNYGKRPEEKAALARIQERSVPAPGGDRSNQGRENNDRGGGKQILRSETPGKSGVRKYADLEFAKELAAVKMSPAFLTDLAAQQKSAHDFYISLTPQEQLLVSEIIDPEKTGMTPEDAANVFYERAAQNIQPRDKELPQREGSGGNSTSPGARHIQKIIEQQKNKTRPLPGEKTPSLESPRSQKNQSYNPSITEHNGGVEPPENNGILKAPEIDWSVGHDIAAIRQSTDTMERTLEKIFPKETASKLNEFLTETDRRNEAAKVRYVSALREETEQKVVKELGIKPATIKSALVQRFGEGRISLDELKAAAPKDWENIKKASDYFRGKYNDLIDKWNVERTKAGLKPITKRPNYFRHFIDLSSFAKLYGLDFKESNLPTAISGITEYFRSQAPWTNAAMRRLGNTTTDDAVGGFDEYLDSVGRSIFHTDTVQHGRLMEKYMRNAADANAHAAQDMRDAGKDADTPPPINLPKFAQTMKGWTDKVSGKQNIFDRSLEAMVGRPSLAVMRAITRQFGLNVIGGNLSAAATHIIPINYTLATTDKGAIARGLVDMTTAPFLEDFTKVAGQTSDFLSRRFGKDSIAPGLVEKVASAISKPFHWVDQFISRLTVSSKYFEGISKGLSPQEAIKQADSYASRVVGDRSSGNLPPIMSTKTLGWLTQFQIEVNDNLHVLLHDIPTWERGNVLGIANRFVQFAAFAYLTNQTLQYMKGSGKGLDPIDLGLTLAGLNDEGHDQTLMSRLGLVGGDLLKELPFSSVPTGGQIPAFQPLVQAGTDVSTGKYGAALQQLLASFASPIGGGQQLQKSLTALQAWKQGYVTDAQGHIIATVPQTIPELMQGLAFGKSAFPTVKKSNSEITTLDATIKAQQAAGKMKDAQAANIWQQLKGEDKATATAQLKDLANTDPDMAKRVIVAAKSQAAGITKEDVLVKSLGVANQERAKYIVGQLKGMQTTQEKKTYLEDLAQKKILTSEVLTQVVQLMK